MTLSKYRQFRLAAIALNTAWVVLFASTALLLATGWMPFTGRGAGGSGGGGGGRGGGLLPQAWRDNPSGGIWRFSPGSYVDANGNLMDLHVRIECDRARIMGIYAWTNLTVTLSDAPSPYGRSGNEPTRAGLVDIAAKIFEEQKSTSGLIDGEGLFQRSLKNSPDGGTTGVPIVRVFYARVLVAVLVSAARYGLWLALAAVPAAALAQFVLRRRLSGVSCGQCGYSLDGLGPSAACPECGAPRQ